MSDNAPDRIWVDWRPGLAVTNGPLTDVHQGWVRADLHDAALARVAKLEGALRLYSCDDGCDECPEHERDRVSCGWTALAALAAP